MKLYIATTTLNFDAIVSTESISPASFYQLRRFGISLFYDKASLMKPNSILLTDVFPYFSINRDEVAHRPMVIEIDDSNYPGMFNKVKDNNGYSVYQTGQTIYLSPLSSVFYFYSEGDKRATLSKAESILEAKYCLYDALGALKVFDSRNAYVKLGPDAFNQINDFAVPESSSIKEDIVVNKAKGFIVSYMIGASLSMTKESARLQRLVKDIKNGIYSMGTKERNSASSKEAIFALAQEANTISKDLDVKKAKADSRVREYLDSVQASSMLKDSSSEDIISFLKSIDLYKYLFDRVNPRYKENDILSLVRLAMTAKDDATQEEIFSHLQSYADSITRRAGVAQALSDLFVLGVDRNVIECNDVTLNDDSRRKVEIMFNLYSGYGYKPNDIRANRIDYIYDAGSAFFPEKTAENQVERDYINAMLDNLEHASSFDIHSTSSEALKALAAFMRTPDSDIDKMVSFLVSNEINDPRIAFGLWGIFYGYSNIPQAYFNAFVSSLTKEDKVSFATQLYLALFSKKPISVAEKETGANVIAVRRKKTGVFNKLAEFMGLGPSEQEEQPGPGFEQKEQPKTEIREKVAREEEVDLWTSAGIDPFDERGAQSTDQNDLGSSTEGADDYGAKSEQSSDVNGDDLPLGYEHVYGILFPIIENADAKNKKTREEFFAYYPVKVKEACESASSLIGLYNAIEAIPDVVAKTAWKGVRQNIKKCIQELQVSEMEARSKSRREKLEAEISSGGKRLFYRDDYAWDIILGLLPKDKDIIEQVKEDFNWFMNSYGNPPYYENKPTDNENCLKAFHRFLRNKLERPNISPSVRRIYSKVDIESIVTVLKGMYN